MQARNKGAKRNFCRSLMSIATALVMVLLSLAPGVQVQAANTAAVGTTTTFDEYLIMGSDANVPNVTFTFTVTPGAAADATATSPRIEAGIGTPTAGTAVFGPTNNTYTTVQDNDSVTLGTNEKYAKQTVTVDFTGISFPAPGIYRYVVTEAFDPVNGVAADASATRTLDVHVRYAEGSETELTISYYEMRNGEKKSAGFTHEYSTNNLTLKKVVTGNQGDRNKQFTFTVTLTAQAGNQYKVVQGNDVSSLTVGEQGTVTGTFQIKHNETVEILGLAVGDTFTISENDYTTESYTTTYTVNGGDSVTGCDLDATQMGDTAMEIVFTNHRQGTVPTGILMEAEPYLILGAVVLAALAVLIVSGKKRHARG